jgi:hypothetical protein
MRVNVVECRYNDSVDIFAIEELMVIGVLIHFGAGRVFAAVAPRIPDVCDSHPVEIADLVGAPHQVRASVS